MTEAEPQSEATMTLFEHLQELRSRVVKCALAVLVLGAASLVFAKPIFGVLMQPVLDALPPDQRSLIYTSGVEEINVLMKVGLYAGVFLTTPVILWQIWGFVSPGLYPSEKRWAAPFVVAGSAAFLTGALFCYFVLLPTMFGFLLREGAGAELADRIAVARLHEEDVLRHIRLGDLDAAGALARTSAQGLPVRSPVNAWIPALAPSDKVTVEGQLAALGRLIDATGEGLGQGARPVLRRALAKRVDATRALASESFAQATRDLDEAASLLASAAPDRARQFSEVWTLGKSLAAASAQHRAEAWTQPMLTMREQLSLVLILELIFGVIFELPLVIAVLSMVGLVKASFLMKYQRHAFVVVLIAAAVLTPTGDALNLALMAGPMFLCFELGVLAAWLIERRRRDPQVATTAIRPT